MSNHSSFAEVATQLYTLGYRTGDRVYIRALVPKNTPGDVSCRRGMAFQPEPGNFVPLPKEGYLTLLESHCSFTLYKRDKDSDKWQPARTFADGLAYLTKLNQHGYGIYLIVNSGGRLDEDIVRCPALFYECDNITIQEQFDKVDELVSQGYQPSFVLQTRNSLHVYFRTYEEGVEDWRTFQQRFIQRQDSDKSIHNPNRLMRLAGFHHWQWNKATSVLEPFRLQIRLATDAIYRRCDLDEFLPAHDAERWAIESSGNGFKVTCPTDPTDNPWDIRNFAHYLDDYRPDGRRRWGHTAKCPAHNGVANNSLHINRDTGATKCHGSGNCSGKEIYDAALELAMSRGYQLPAKRRGYSYKVKSGISTAIASLVNCVKNRVRQMPWGLGAKPATMPASLQSSAYIDFYESGKRLEMWRQKIMQEYRHILDTSGTGRGKSHDAGRCVPETLGAKKLFYASENHRNPTTQTLREGWTDCDPRHDGLYRDEQGNLRRQGKEGEGYVVAPNCGRVQTSAALRDKQIDGADETSLLCQTCPALEPCRKGATFGYIRQRSEALTADKVRIHPQSLPPVHDKDGNIDYDYSDDVLLHDEVGQFFKTFRAFSVGVFDVQRTVADLLIAAPEQFQSLQSFLATLLKYLKGEIPQSNKYGWNHRDTAEVLVSEGLLVDIDSIRQALEVDLRERLSTTDKYGVALADLPGAMRGKFSDSDRTAAEKIRAEVALQWLPEVLEVLTGIASGALQICGGKLTVTVTDYRYREVVQHSKANIYLDATLTPERLAQMIGCDVDEIAHIQEYQPAADNLELTQVMGLGRLGISGRSEFLQKRVDAVVDELRGTLEGKAAVIDFKRYQPGGQNAYAWFRDSRGSNDLQDVVNLVLVGTPCQNLAALEAEYICITGRVPAAGRVTKTFSVQVPGRESDSQEPKFTCEVSEDEDFADFCHQRIVANIIQAIGRLRADRRPEEKLRVYFLGDYPLPMPVKLRQAVEITPEASDKVERLVAAVKKAKAEIEARGKEASQRAIARIVGCSQPHVHRLLRLIHSANNDSNSRMYQGTNGTQEGSDAHMLGTEYFPLLAKEDPLAQVEGLLNTFSAFGERIVVQAWSLLSAAASIQLQTGLLLALPEAEFNELSAIA